MKSWLIIVILNSKLILLYNMIMNWSLTQLRQAIIISVNKLIYFLKKIFVQNDVKHMICALSLIIFTAM